MIGSLLASFEDFCFQSAAIDELATVDKITKDDGVMGALDFQLVGENVFTFEPPAKVRIVMALNKVNVVAVAGKVNSAPNVFVNLKTKKVAEVYPHLGSLFGDFGWVRNGVTFVIEFPWVDDGGLVDFFLHGCESGLDFVLKVFIWVGKLFVVFCQCGEFHLDMQVDVSGEVLWF